MPTRPLRNGEICPVCGSVFCDHPVPLTSDEALAELRKKLTGNDEKLDSTPVSITVFTTAGNVTVSVREDSIEFKDNRLIAEGVVEGETLNDLYTFINVIGWMTRP